MNATRIKEVRGNVLRHFRRDIWAKDMEGSGLWRRRAMLASRMVYMVVTGFLSDHCIIRASALTFTTILAIVPLLAVAFSISKGFGLQNADFFRDFLMGLTADRAEVVDKILQYIGNTNVKTLGWMGVAALLFTVFTTVGNVERAFNTIWAVKKGRTSWRKFTDFFTIIVIGPLVVLVTASFSVAVQQNAIVHAFIANPSLDWLERLVFKLLSLSTVWLGFTFAYAFVPNTRVRLQAAAVGGVIAGSMWQLAQWGYIHWQIGFTKYNAIYGSFAQLPLFLIWLYASWVLVLLGAEISYAAQHVHAFVRRGLDTDLSPLSRQKVAVLALAHLAVRFLAARQPQSLAAAAQDMRLPEGAVGEALAQLAEAGMVARTGTEDEPGYVLAVTPESIRMAEVAQVVQQCGDGDSCGQLFAGNDGVEGLFAAFERALRESPANVTLVEYVRENVLRLKSEAAQAGGQ